MAVLWWWFLRVAHFHGMSRTEKSTPCKRPPAWVCQNVKDTGGKRTMDMWERNWKIHPALTSTMMSRTMVSLRCVSSIKHYTYVRWLVILIWGAFDLKRNSTTSSRARRQCLKSQHRLIFLNGGLVSALRYFTRMVKPLGKMRKENVLMEGWVILLFCAHTFCDAEKDLCSVLDLTETFY